jgi:hypothetical protein
MPRTYTRKYHRELDDLLYFLMEYPELRHHLTWEEGPKVERRRQQLINWLWRQMGRKGDPPVLDAFLPEITDEIEYPPVGISASARRLVILGLYERWRTAEPGRNSGEKAKARLMKEFGFKTKEAVDKYLQRARRTRALFANSDPFDIPF